jgi:hypothetical protein
VEPAVFVAPVSVVASAIWLWKRLGGQERREPIDIEQVIDEKYPNRAALEPVPELEVEAALDPVLEAAPAPRPARREVVDLLAEEPEAPALPAFMAAGFPPPLTNAGPHVPIPGEPDDLPTTRHRATEPAAGPVAEGYVGDPYEQVKQRRDRVATQAAEAFREVHVLRTEALRRASQAEHNASLAAHARNRAGRMVRDTRRVESQGRVRSAEMPNSQDAFADVHTFRTEALKRAQQAEHGAAKVAQARERATRLLAEQRELEAEMAKLQRLRTAAAAR